MGRRYGAKQACQSLWLCEIGVLQIADCPAGDTRCLQPHQRAGLVEEDSTRRRAYEPIAARLLNARSSAARAREPSPWRDPPMPRGSRAGRREGGLARRVRATAPPLSPWWSSCLGSAIPASSAAEVDPWACPRDAPTALRPRRTPSDDLNRTRRPGPVMPECARRTWAQAAGGAAGGRATCRRCRRAGTGPCCEGAGTHRTVRSRSCPSAS